MDEENNQKCAPLSTEQPDNKFSCSLKTLMSARKRRQHQEYIYASSVFRCNVTARKTDLVTRAEAEGVRGKSMVGLRCKVRWVR